MKFIEVVKRGVDFLLVSRTKHANIARFKATTYRDNFSLFIERKYNCSRIRLHNARSGRAKRNSTRTRRLRRRFASPTNVHLEFFPENFVNKLHDDI